MTMQASSELCAVHDDGTFFDWLRHYGALMGLFLVVGIIGGAIYAVLGRSIEATTLIVYRGEAIPAREFGVVGGAVFQSDTALRPAMDELGISTSTQRFLEESVQLRPVPDARILIVMGRASTAERAREVSSTMARALRAALADAGLGKFAVLRGEITRRSLSPLVVVAVGGFSGLWLGVGAAIALYHAHRPVLSLTRALHLTTPRPVTLLDGRASWLGVLRRIPRLRKGERNDLALSRLAMQEPRVSVVMPGGDARRRRSLMRRLAQELRDRGASVGAPPDTDSHSLADGMLGPSMVNGGTTLLVTDARTRERELALEGLGRTGEEVHLLWVL
jgi:hypothetical protein